MIRSSHVILLRRFGTDSKFSMKELIKLKKPKSACKYINMFKMLGHENIDKMTTRFMHIINQLKALGKRYTNAKMVRKILRSLLRPCVPR